MRFATTILRLLPLVLVLALPRPAVAQGAAATLELVREDGGTKMLRAADLAALPQVEVPSRARDSTPVTLRGPALRTLLDLAGAPSGHEIRGPRLMLAVVAEADDGYRVVFSLAELDPSFGARTAILAMTQDGGPLPAAEGPYRLVLPDEGHFSRWVRQVVRLRVVMVAP